MAGEDHEPERMQTASINNIIAAITCFWIIAGRSECGASGVAWNRGTQHQRALCLAAEDDEKKKNSKKIRTSRGACTTCSVEERKRAAKDQLRLNLPLASPWADLSSRGLLVGASGQTTDARNRLARGSFLDVVKSTV